MNTIQSAQGEKECNASRSLPTAQPGHDDSTLNSSSNSINGTPQNDKELKIQSNRSHRSHASSSITIPDAHIRDPEKPNTQDRPVRQNDIPVRPQLDTRPTTQQTAQSMRSLPSLKRKETRMMQKHAHPWEHLGITLGLPAIVLFDIIVPIIIYYSWYNSHKRRWQRQCREEYTDQGLLCPLEKPQFNENILGYAVISFGFGELWILLARVWRLYFRRDECAPLLSRHRWELDATSWVYAVAMLIALVPFVTGSSLVMPHLYLYGPVFLMGFLGILMVVTTVYPFRIPIGINSQPKATQLRPFIYYAAEDFIAVDGLQDREFRVRFNDRYENNKAFRRMFLYLTLWWIFGVCTYIGCVSAVIWTCEFHVAFGLSLGVLFAYIATWAAVSAVWVKFEIRRQHKAFEAGDYSDWQPMREAQARLQA